MPIFGEYQTLGEPISVIDERGHISTVWQARKSGDNRLFAIKCYAPRTREAKAAQTDELDKDRGIEFLEAIKQLKKAQSEGGRCLSPVHDMGIAPEGAWYATDFYPGRSLRAWITNRGNVDNDGLKQVVYSCVAGCLALKASRGYSHGNLKSTNVFLVGSPRPLRKRPLQLGDPYPASASHLANLDAEDRAAVTELLAQTAEVQDLRAIGELILQLVEGRVVANAYDYNYPIDRSRHWDSLGKDGETWRTLCNQLLDPHLAPETISLEELQRRFTPNPMAERLPLILGVAAGVIVASALGFFAVAKWKHAASTPTQVAVDDNEFQAAVKSGQMALDSGDYDGAVARALQALKLKPGDPAALKLQSDAKIKLDELNKGERDARYVRAMADATQALANADQALTGANYEKALSDLEAASTSCTMARNNGDVKAVEQLTSQIERKKNDVRNARDTATKAARYVLALNEATNALQSADSAADGTNALNFIDAAIKSCAVARTNGDKDFVDSFIKVLTTRRGEITRNMSRGEQYANALNEATNAFDRAEQALSKTNYQTASREFETASANCSIALTNASGSQSGLVKQFQQRIEDRRKTAGESMARADRYADALKDATNAWLRAETAIRNTNYQTASLELSTALEKCAIAKTNGDALAVERFSGQLTNRNREVSLKIDLSNEYTKALRDATNAMNLADLALKRGDYSSAFTNISLALDHSASARSKGDAGPVSQLEDELRKRRAGIEGTIRFQTAMGNATNSLQQAEAAEKKGDWDGALRAIQQASTYAEMAGTNKQTSELAQLRRLLETRESTINVRKDKIDRYAKAMDQATKALAAGEEAYKAANYDDALKSLREGLHYCDSAATNAENMTAVNDLRKLLSARENTIQIAIAATRRYREAMASATNNWNQAIAAGTNYDSALALVQNALKDCAAAATNQATDDTPQLISELNTLRSRLESGKKTMIEKADLVAAQTSFNNGDYETARALCGKHQATAEFDLLGKNIAGEKAALDRDQQDFAAGKYAFLKDLENQSYSKKRPFADLAAKGKEESDFWSRLIAQTNRASSNSQEWSKLDKELNAVPADLLRKDSFARLRTAADEWNPSTKLDRKLAKFQAQFGTAPGNQEIRDENGKVVARLERGIDQDYYLKELDKLKAQYGSNLSAKQKKAIKEVENAINNWN